MNACANHVTRSGDLHRHAPAHEVTERPTGTFLRIKVRPCSRTRAERIARHQARDAGFRVLDIASVVDQGPESGWIVEALVSKAGHSSRKAARS